MIFKNRQEAGQQLAEKLTKYAKDKPIVVALPRGGVVLGYEVAKKLKAPLDILVARKIGAPLHPEFGIGAIAPNGIFILNTDLIKSFGITESELKKVIKTQTKEMTRRVELYRQDLPLIDLKNRTVIVIDDGLATGVTTQAAILSIKQMSPKKIILAVPISPPDTANKFRKKVDEFLCLLEPAGFYAVGAYYEDFEQVTDDEVISLIRKSKNNYYTLH